MNSSQETRDRVEREVDEEEVTGQPPLPAPVEVEQNEKAQQAPERFVEEDGMKAGLQRILDQAAIRLDAAGSVNTNAPGQVGRRAVELLVDEVGPAANRLAHRQRHRGDVSQGPGISLLRRK